MYPHNKKEESILLAKPVYRGLAPTASRVYGQVNTPNSNTNNSNQNNAPTNVSIPFGAEMIEPMMELFEQCPAGELGLRIFQQHAEQGTCWNDAMYMILFNSDELKPAMRPVIRRLMELNAEEGTLDFGNVGTTDVKLNRFSRTLRAEFNPHGSIAVWELLILNAQRYLQLLYLFLHEPSVKNTVVKKNINYSRLMTRRKSLQCNTYTKFHAFTKPSVTYESYGAHASYEFVASVNKFLKSISPEGYRYKFDHIKPVDSSMIHGYYLIKYNHVISLFRCDGIWILYDNDIGSALFSPEDSAKLDINMLKAFGKLFTHDTCTYTFVLDNDERIEVQMDYSGRPAIFPIDGHNSYGISKYYFIKQPTGGAVVDNTSSRLYSSPFGIALSPVASLNGNHDQEGGRRRHRKTQRKRRHPRKKTRAYK